MAILPGPALFRAVHAQEQAMSSALMTGMAYSALTKAMGSIFRVTDDRHAPPAVQKNTVKRESLTVLLTSLCGGGVKVLYNSVVQHLKAVPRSSLNQLGRQLERLNEPITVALICSGTLLAEFISRKIAPRNIWKAASTNQQSPSPIRATTKKPAPQQHDEPHFLQSIAPGNSPRLLCYA